MHKPIPVQYLDRLIYPVIPAFVVVSSGDRVGGLLAAWWTQLSFKPLLVGVAIAPERYTYRLLCSSDRFSINLVGFEYVDSMPYIGDVSERFLKDKIRRAGFNIGWNEEYGVPYIEEAHGYIALRLIDRRPYGDHDLFVGEVLAAYADDAFVDGMWDLSRYRPIMYLGRTRRPAKVKRVYVTFKEFTRRDLEFAGGELKKYSESRYAVLNRLRNIYRKYKDADREVLEGKFREVLREYGLDDEDVKYYIEELSRTA